MLSYLDVFASGSSSLALEEQDKTIKSSTPPKWELERFWASTVERRERKVDYVPIWKDEQECEIEEVRTGTQSFEDFLECVSAEEELDLEDTNKENSVSPESRLVRGKDIKEADISYTIEGLYPYEMAVIGVYVDPRIYPGFHYRVRSADMPMFYFKGKSLRLENIGRGYAKWLEFETDSCDCSQNCFWSDSNPDGFAFSIQVLFKNMEFKILSNEKINPKDNPFNVELHQNYPVLGKLLMTSVEDTQIELSSTTNFRREVTKHVACKGMCKITTNSGQLWQNIDMSGSVKCIRDRTRLGRVVDITKVKLGQGKLKNCSVWLVPV